MAMQGRAPPHQGCAATLASVRKETIMLALTIRYSRYALSALGSVGFALQPN
jgi:hypothetical protein